MDPADFDSVAYANSFAKVGSTVITRKAGEHVKRAEELGYFKFGGSTLLLLCESGAMKFDDDLVSNSNGAVETLVSIPFLPTQTHMLTLVDSCRDVHRLFT